MYSRGIFGSWREKMFFRAMSAVALESFPSFVYVWKVTASSPVPTVPKDAVPDTPCGTNAADEEDEDDDDAVAVAAAVAVSVAVAVADDEEEDEDEDEDDDEEEEEEDTATSSCAKG